MKTVENSEISEISESSEASENSESSENIVSVARCVRPRERYARRVQQRISVLLSSRKEEVSAGPRQVTVSVERAPGAERCVQICPDVERDHRVGRGSCSRRVQRGADASECPPRYKFDVSIVNIHFFWAPQLLGTPTSVQVTHYFVTKIEFVRNRPKMRCTLRHENCASVTPSL